MTVAFGPVDEVAAAGSIGSGEASSLGMMMLSTINKASCYYAHGRRRSRRR